MIRHQYVHALGQILNTKLPNQLIREIARHGRHTFNFCRRQSRNRGHYLVRNLNLTKAIFLMHHMDIFLFFLCHISVSFSIILFCKPQSTKAPRECPKLPQSPRNISTASSLDISKSALIYHITAIYQGTSLHPDNQNPIVSSSDTKVPQ